ncbi:unnamed protein product [Brassica oleracea]|uniref:Myb/SANT-like domain-containing protein n=2 Tax=Brassica oleracea TaxID=3712 RepID=A0A0D3DSG2_BRAOL|nr:PREDICTED: L10-interacting MYB domain-containing protein-like [Brassica oleracea var. oleracea]VDD57042.1 unnamed protein product [Brassica oleracea]
MATGNSSDQQQYQPHPVWTALLTKLLANLILDQVRKGNTANNSLSNKAWNFITNEFYTRSGIKRDKEHLKNRFAALRREFSVVKLILARDNFVFDESTGCIIAADESWDQYVKECPDAEAVRRGGCPVYTQLSQIFGVVHLEEEPLLPQRSYEYAAVKTPKKRPSRGVEASIASAIVEMAAASRLRTNALTQMKSRFTLAECIRELDGINGVAENVYFAALEIFNNPSARETFLSLRSDMRLTWLQWKCTLNISNNQ